MRFLSLDDGQGAKMARPIFAGFISRLEKDPKSGFNPNLKFERPPGDLGVEIDCHFYRDSVATDEEEFNPDKFNDEANPAADPNAPAPAKRPDETFGDEIHHR